MKKYLVLLGLLLVVSCFREDTEEFYSLYVPKNLEISELFGLKLENYIVEDEVAMNVKLPESSTYRVKILDIENTIISQEKIQGNEGDNILKVYVKSLPHSSFTIVLENEFGDQLGSEIFSKK